MTHTFITKTVHKPTNCEACDGLLWGVRHQGQQCQGKKRRKEAEGKLSHLVIIIKKEKGWVNL